MRTINKLAYPRTLTTVPLRAFSYSLEEIRELQMKFNRSLNVIKLYNKQPEFSYEPPKMIYDKATGDVTILDPKAGKQKRIIKNFKELDMEKKRLFKELGIKDDINLETEEAQTEFAVKLEELANRMKKELDFDPRDKYAFSRDYMRVDVGLIIMRAPIFMQMHDRDFAFLKNRTHHFNEYFMDLKKYVE